MLFLWWLRKPRGAELLLLLAANSIEASRIARDHTGQADLTQPFVGELEEVLTGEVGKVLLAKLEGLALKEQQLSIDLLRFGNLEEVDPRWNQKRRARFQRDMKNAMQAKDLVDNILFGITVDLSN